MEHSLSCSPEGHQLGTCQCRCHTYGRIAELEALEAAFEKKAAEQVLRAEKAEAEVERLKKQVEVAGLMLQFAEPSSPERTARIRKHFQGKAMP